MKDKEKTISLIVGRIFLLLTVMAFSLGSGGVSPAHAAGCYSLTITTSPSAGGTVTINTPSNCAGGLYNDGTVVSLTAVPGSQYILLGWAGTNSNFSNPTTVTMNANKSVTVKFVAKNDAIGGATTINSLTYTDTVSVDESLDNDSYDPVPPTSPRGVCQDLNEFGNEFHLNEGYRSLWYKYTPPENQTIQADTIGSWDSLNNQEMDTYVVIWKKTSTDPNPLTLSFEACNDDFLGGRTSQFTFTGLQDITYYIEVAEFGGRVEENSTGASVDGTIVFNAHITNTRVGIGENTLGNYYLSGGESRRESYINIDNGPIKVESTGQLTIASMRINLKTMSTYSSYTEFMGIPASKLTDTYLFPWYNNATAGGLSSQLRFGNVGNVPTTVTIKIAGVVQPTTYTLAPNESTRVTFDNIDNGPVEIKSSGGVPIVASIRINLKTMTTYSSYTEMMGLSASSIVGTKYMFPWYNNATAGGLSSQLRFGNVGNGATTVTIKIGGVAQPNTYTLAPNESARATFDDVDKGPVEVTSSGGVPIIASMRMNLKTLPTYSSYSEIMGLPGAVLTDTRYVFPIYTNVAAGGLQSQLRFGNVGNATTVVTIKIGGVTQPTTYTLAPSESTRVIFNEVDNGPIEVISSGGVPIIASMRVNLKTNPTYSSYAEMMGLSVGAPLGMPGNELSTTYWFPWYNNATAGGLNSQLRFGVP